MSNKSKTLIHKHTHPVYAWIALIVSVTIILGVAGWYYLTISGGYNDDLVYSVLSISAPIKETSATSTTKPVDTVTATTQIDYDIDSILDSDLSDTQLDDTILGI